MQEIRECKASSGLTLSTKTSKEKGGAFYGQQQKSAAKAGGGRGRKKDRVDPEGGEVKVYFYRERRETLRLRKGNLCRSSAAGGGKRGQIFRTFLVWVEKTVRNLIINI